MKAWRAILLALSLIPFASSMAADLPTGKVRALNGGGSHVAEGVVEAVRQSTISAQVSGRIVELPIKTGDRVEKGQLLLRIDSRAAMQEARASQAQVASARAQLEVARKEFERQKYLFSKKYLSQAALDQAEAQFKATEAALRGSSAMAGAVGTQAGFYTVSAPYAGVVSDVPTMVGEMAMPGKSLLTMYAPAEMRVVASLPQSRLSQLPSLPAVRIELPALPESKRWQQAASVVVLPTADPTSQNVEVRLGLPESAAGVTPGMFARVYFPMSGEKESRLLIPQKAVLRRGELTAVYVVTADGHPQLRQVRLGRTEGDEIEALAGVAEGECVALDPLLAARGR